MYKSYIKNFQNSTYWDDGKNRISRNIAKQARESAISSYNKKASKIEIGQLIHGRVYKITKQGAFVVFENGITAFLHISQISDKWLNHPTEKINKNDTLLLKVISKNKDYQGKISIKVRIAN